MAPKLTVVYVSRGVLPGYGSRGDARCEICILFIVSADQIMNNLLCRRAHVDYSISTD